MSTVGVVSARDASSYKNINLKNYFVLCGTVRFLLFFRKYAPEDLDFFLDFSGWGGQTTTKHRFLDSLFPNRLIKLPIPTKNLPRVAGPSLGMGTPMRSR